MPKWVHRSWWSQRRSHRLTVWASASWQLTGGVISQRDKASAGWVPDAVQRRWALRRDHRARLMMRRTVVQMALEAKGGRSEDSRWRAPMLSPIRVMEVWPSRTASRVAASRAYSSAFC